VGLAISFKMNFWNIGAEGQLLMGAVGATWVALYFTPNTPLPVMLTLMFCGGFAAGAGWGLIPAVLKAKFKANEVIVSLMLVYIASELVNYLVYGPWKSPYEWGFPYSIKFPASARIPTIPHTRIHYPTLILALVLALIIYILMRRTKAGYEIEVLGASPEAARYAGIGSTRIILLIMVISGGLAGLAGVGEVAGIHRRLLYPSGISPGYGFTAIIVAWLGGLNPLLLIPAAFLFGGLLVGGDAIQVTLGLPVGVINIFNGVILFFLLAGKFFTQYRLTK
jgi:simple sugar transport system permease protein